MAIKSDNRNLSFGEFVNVLHGLVRDRRTGTVFFLADSRHYARIGLQQGQITTIVYGKHKGQEALDHLAQAESGMFSFADNVVGSTREHVLPPTNLLLQWLHDSVFAKAAGGSGRAVSETVAPPPGVDGTLSAGSLDAEDESLSLAADLAAEQGDVLRLAGDALYETVTRELARYIGPVAPVVTSDFRIELVSATTGRQVRGILDQLAEDIGDPRQAEAFRVGVMALAIG